MKSSMSAETLITLRKLAGLSQTGLAARFGISRWTVARWESGAPIPMWVELALRAL